MRTSALGAAQDDRETGSVAFLGNVQKVQQKGEVMVSSWEQ